MKHILTCLFAIMASLSAMQVNAQCCAAGSAFTGADHGPGLARGDLAVSIFNRYGLSSGYFLGDEESELGDIRRSDLLYSELILQYGISSRLSVKADIGYFYFKREQYKNANAPDAIGRGLGDTKFSMNYMLFNNPKRHSFLRAGLGISLPTGEFDQEMNNIRLPLTLQASSGSWKLLGNLVFSKDQTPKMTLAASLHYEKSMPINSRFFHYQYGDVWALSGGAQYKWRKNVNAALMARVQMSANAKRDGSTVVEATGGRIIYLSPELRVRIFKQYQCITSIDIPLFKYYNGVQLSHSLALQLRISRVFKTGKAASLNS